MKQYEKQLDEFQEFLERNLNIHKYAIQNNFVETPEPLSPIPPKSKVISITCLENQIVVEIVFSKTIRFITEDLHFEDFGYDLNYYELLELLIKRFLSLTQQKLKYEKQLDGVSDFSKTDWNCFGGSERFSENEQPVIGTIIMKEWFLSDVIQSTSGGAVTEENSHFVIVGDKSGIGIFGTDISFHLNLETNKDLIVTICNYIIENYHTVLELENAGFELFHSTNKNDDLVQFENLIYKS